nr:phosphoribosylaminoimidazolesuccinocarboxamide synthase [Pyrinomonadaceae bacterium]
MSAVNTISETNFDDLRLIHRGKVRDVYDLHENRLLLVATDRISAFDCIMPTQIPNKGEILTSISAFWFEFLSDITANHLLTTNFEEMPENVRRHEILRERSTLVKKTKVFPVECVVRGYLEGSGWKDYQATGEVCGHKLPAGMLHCEKLSAPIFTPATKAEKGHDENISEARFAEIIGTQNAVKLKNLSLEIYKKASQYALKKGIIIADTKFEF